MKEKCYLEKLVGKNSVSALFTKTFTMCRFDISIFKNYNILGESDEP